MDRHIIFKCPQTGMNVQHRLAAVPADVANTHVSVECPACTRLHFINRSTGQILGDTKRRD
ncbi:hypothetical protein G8O24_32430 [Bradyrhizobium sp. INPA01-394B]|uniref:Small CPxCG-related zinc finger protein n=2 Tax=Bradyrhizobium campsiandrae TaxID=1729892 RepID=A0ABR7ULH6_9BRAD|nr:hypothetical protein [Bradyrhizobium campsiandrae]MBC9984480.1 hypothetical protein [Bradyrhizobium campsiandrae]